MPKFRISFISASCALGKLTLFLMPSMIRLNIVYPMLFKLSNKKTSRTTHCGVLEFVADEGKIYIPYWMMQVDIVMIINPDEDENANFENEDLKIPQLVHIKHFPHERT